MEGLGLEGPVHEDEGGLMEFDLYKTRDEVDPVADWAERMRRFQKRWGRYISPAVSLSINNSIHRIGDNYEDRHVYIDKVEFLFQQRFGHGDDE